MFRCAARAVLLIAVVIGPVGACSKAPKVDPGGSAGADSALLEAAAKVKDACSVFPKDLAAQLIAGGSFSEEPSPVPPKCTYSNGTSVLELTIGAFDSGGPVAGAETISGLAAGGYLEKPDPDDAYLTVLLSPDHGAIYVELAGHDGKDHRDDVITVARKVLATLH